MKPWVADPRERAGAEVLLGILDKGNFSLRKVTSTEGASEALRRKVWSRKPSWKCPRTRHNHEAHQALTAVWKAQSFMGSGHRIIKIKTFCPGKAAKCQAAFPGRQAIKSLAPSAHKRVKAESKMKTRSDTAESGQAMKVICCRRPLGSRRSYSELRWIRPPPIPI